MPQNWATATAKPAGFREACKGLGDVSRAQDAHAVVVEDKECVRDVFTWSTMRRMNKVSSNCDFARKTTDSGSSVCVSTHVRQNKNAVSANFLQRKCFRKSAQYRVALLCVQKGHAGL